MPQSELKTPRQWSALGRKIHRGEKYRRKIEGELMFARDQTYDPDIGRTMDRIARFLGYGPLG